MQFALPQLTTIVLLVHMGLGCCWHHAHACAAGDYGHAVGDEEPFSHADHEHISHFEHCSHVDGNHGCPHDDHQRHQHECDGDRCTFVRSKSAFEQNSDLTVSVLCDSSLPALISWDVLWQGFERPFDSGEILGGVPLPLRAHLLYCVLLI